VPGKRRNQENCSDPAKAIFIVPPYAMSEVAMCIGQEMGAAGLFKFLHQRDLE